MKIELTSQNVKLTDNLRELIEKKLAKFHRFFGDEAVWYVKIRPEHEKLLLELTLKIRRDLYRAEAVAESTESAMEAAVKKMEGQIRKHKTKLKRRKRVNDPMQLFVEELPDEIVEEESEIVRVKRFPIEVMHPEEATLQMELMGHDFFLYLDGDSGRVCCVYKRRDGDYGVLAPEY